MNYPAIEDIVDNREYVETLLHDLLYFTLPQLLNVFDYKFAHPSELEHVIELDDDHWTRHGNPYLRNCKDDRLSLAYSILEKGMYYPFIVVKEEGHVAEGCHRVITLKSIDTPRDRKFLCILIDKDIYSWHRNTRDREYQISFKFAEEYKDLRPELRRYDENGITIMPDIVSSVKMWNNYATWLGRQLYFYQRDSGEMIPPYRINDNEEVFNREIKPLI